MVWRKGESGNPTGRPRGAVDKRAKITDGMLAAAGLVAEQVLAKALLGDMQAARLLLDRVLPTVRAQAQSVKFELPADSTPADQARAVLAAIAQGEIDPATGQSIIAAISAAVGIIEATELEARIAALEGKQ